MKICFYQGRKNSDGCITCERDGSRRRAENCCEGKCKRWKRPLLEKIVRWINYGVWD